MVVTPEQPNGNNNNNNNNNKKGWNKRKGKSSQEPSKKQQLVAVHASTVSANTAPSKPYACNLPKCNKCNFHHNENCWEMQCRNCNRKGHTARFCRSPPQPINQVPAVGVGQACYQCGDVGNFKRDCLKAGNVGGNPKIS
ncbi:zinc finger protein GIS2-like [Lactuca sativa]|uniref:zinc finger protein GIS2-like n=1 Tax=Lactuca sativa TaxID=4236 RepID=UPI000CD90823|nr:zinc finger protein GIS2-like [Lactuca sativa]